MKRRTLVHLAALLACFFLLARPGRLLSSVSPRFEGTAIDRILTSVTDGSGPGFDAFLGDDAVDRIYDLRGFHRTRGTIDRGENLAAELRAAGADPGEALGLCRSLKTVFDPRKARPGDRYDVLVSEGGHIELLHYRRSPVEVYEARARADGWEATRLEIPVEPREVELAGQVSGSLFGSFLRAGADVDLAMAFVELFSWDVDFSRDTRAGDRFRVLYQKLYVGDELVGNGRILAARYEGAAGTYNAIYFRSEKTEGYFDAQGDNVRKSFLRAPLHFTRISSRYSLARRHPVLKIVRPHRGVDYAAPTGTRVWSVADGTVRYAGWKGQAGKTVIVRHSHGYETSYNHLSRIAQGVRGGTRVKQGEVIGYVGQTGLATGPHLDFRVKKHGRWVNPLKERYPAGDPVPADELQAFKSWGGEWIARLDALPTPVKVARAVAR